VKNHEELRSLHLLAQVYSTRPSTILGIQDTWLAYQFDLTVLSVATSKQRARPPKKATGGASFQSLKGLAKKTMKLPENGIW
jgi:hypothetical protein